MDEGRRQGVRVWAVAILAFAGFAACAPRPHSPQYLACTAAPWARAHAALDRRIAGCTALIATAKGDELSGALAARGNAYRLEKNVPAAMQDFGRALGAAPDNIVALNGRGLVYLDQHDYAHATVDFNQAIRAHPDSPSAYNNRGIVERDQGDLGASMHDENRAIELEPTSPNPWLNRGLVFLARRRWGLALADFADALKRSPRLVSALDGAAQAELGQGNVAKAVQAYDLAGNTDFDAGLYPAAIDETDKALAANAEDAAALNLRCWTRAVANIDLPAALADCQHSLKVRPDNANTLDSQAFVRFRMGDFRDAIAGYDAALAKDPKLAPSRFMRGVAELRAGDRDAGRNDIEAAEAMDGTVAATFAGFGVTP